MSTAADRPGPDDDLRSRPGADGLEPDGSRAEPGQEASPAEIEADIARTRRDLGRTVEALSGKLDPKSQADQQVAQLKERARDQVDHARHVVADPNNPVPGLLAAATGAVLFAAVGLLISRRG